MLPCLQIVWPCNETTPADGKAKVTARCRQRTTPSLELAISSAVAAD
jgi:hypothetical protein